MYITVAIGRSIQKLCHNSWKNSKKSIYNTGIQSILGGEARPKLSFQVRALCVDSIQSTRAERTRNRLYNIVKKSWKSADKKEERLKGDMEKRCQEMKERYGYNIEDTLGLQTVAMTREDKIGNWTIRIEFEAYKAPDDDDEDAVIMLFDVIARQGEKDNYIVFTCTPDPTPTLLSVRIVPSERNHLDQSVYDGPDTENISAEVRMGLFDFLKKKGVDMEVFNFIKDYSLRKHQREKVANLEGTVEFLNIVAAP